MMPLVPLATTALIVLSFKIMNELAAVPPKLTAEVPVKPVPLIFTVDPVLAIEGKKEVMLGFRNK